MNGPGAVEYGPQLRAPETSLLTVSEIVTESDNRWMMGVGIEGEVADYSIKPFGICSEDAERDKTLANTWSSDSWDPFVVYTDAKCSTWGLGRAEEAKSRGDKATRLLYTIESAAVEQALFSGAEGTSNPIILDGSATTVTSAPTNPVAALALVEQAWSDATHGAPGLYHVRPNVFVILVTAQAIQRRENGQWYTPIGTPVYPARGLGSFNKSGAAPTSGSSWSFMTGRVQVRRGPIEEISDLAQTIDRQSNDLTLLRERLYLANWATELPKLAAENTFTYTF